MTRKERVLAALRHQASDKVPHHCDFTEQARRIMAPHFAAEAFEDDVLDNHLYCGQYWGWPTEREPGSERFVDEYGVTWNRSGADKDIGVVDHPVIPAPDMAYYREPAFDEARFRRAVEQVSARGSDQFKVFGIGFSLFERAWSYLTFEEALYNMAAEPHFMHELFERILAYNLKLIAIVNEYPLDAVYFGDDWGQQHGTLMGPVLWQTFIKPRLARMYEAAHDGGKFIIQHSCGDISALFPDLIEIGLDCYQTFQPEIYDLAWFKREYGRDLSVWGGISTQQLLPRATPDQIRAETIRILRTMSDGGGYIASPTHAVTPDIRFDQIMAMFDVFLNQDRYL